MRGNSQKHDGFIGKVLTEAEFTVWDGATFFTDDKNYAEVSVYPAAPASLQVKPSRSIRQSFRIAVRIIQYPFRLFPDPCLE